MSWSKLAIVLHFIITVNWKLCLFSDLGFCFYWNIIQSIFCDVQISKGAVLGYQDLTQEWVIRGHKGRAVLATLIEPEGRNTGYRSSEFDWSTEKEVCIDVACHIVWVSSVLETWDTLVLPLCETLKSSHHLRSAKLQREEKSNLLHFLILVLWSLPSSNRPKPALNSSSPWRVCSRS